MEKIKHVFFDLDHTLWDFDKNSEKAFETIFKESLPDLEVFAFMEVYVPINQECWSLYQKDSITQEELRYQRLKRSFDALGITVSNQLIDAISEQYIFHLPNSTHLFEGCIETLEYLFGKYKLHIITNGFAEVQFKKMNNSGIYHFFETITSSELAGSKKPNPVIFEYALQQAKATKEESLMIGDSLEADVDGALDFGIEAIFFNSNQIKYSEDRKQITTLVALKNIL